MKTVIALAAALISIFAAGPAMAESTIGGFYFTSAIGFCKEFNAKQAHYSEYENKIREFKKIDGKQSEIEMYERFLTYLDQSLSIADYKAATVDVRVTGGAPSLKNLDFKLGKLTYSRAQVLFSYVLPSGESNYQVNFTVAGLCPYWDLPNDSASRTPGQALGAIEKAWAGLQ